MSTTERKIRDKKNRREQILRAAVATLYSKGFENTTMDEIAESAELSKGTLYFYYKDKSALYRAIQKESVQKLHDEFLKILRQDEPGAVLIRKMSQSFLQFIEENPILTKALSLHTGEATSEQMEEIEQIENEIRVLMTRVLQIGVQDGSIQTDIEPKILAIQIGFCMRGILHFHLSNTQNHICKVMDEHNLTLRSMAKLFIDALLNQIDTDQKKINKK